MPSFLPAISAGASSEGPVAKRQKIDDASGSVETPAWGKTAAQASRLFAPFRTVGLVSSTPVPFSTLPLGKTTFQLTTSVGKCLQTYDVRRGLNLVFLSRPQTPAVISTTASWNSRVFAAWGGSDPDGESGVWVFKRGKKVGELEMPAGQVEPIKQLLVFGSWIVGCCSSTIKVWKSANYEYYTTLTPSGGRAGDPKGVLTGVMSNMPTYLNKILVGRRHGSVEIWNCSTGKMVFSILPPFSDAGPVTALQPAPALSLLAIAYDNGTLIIHDIREDVTIIELNAGKRSRGIITSISFRTDGLGAGADGRTAGVMVTAGPDSGDVTLWDLNRGGRVMGILRGAHNSPMFAQEASGGGISRVEFLPGQPVIVTSGLDNSLKTWIFDEVPFSPVPRPLHSRSGHAAPVSCLEFLPTDADGADAGNKWIVSAAQDRSLWGWSLRRDGQSTELSQGHIRKKAKKMGLLKDGSLSENPGATKLEDLKAPEITCMAMSLNRDGGMGTAAGSSSIWTNTSTSHFKKSQVDASISGTTGWESIVTGHKGDKLARTWFWGRKKAGRWAFETGDGGEVTSVAVTPCGTFALLGSSLGGIDMFNLQSGRHRQRFPAKLTPGQARDIKSQQAGQDLTISGIQPEASKFQPGQGKHKMPVTGLMVDSINHTVISCGLDGKIKFWNFVTGVLMDEVNWSQTTGINSGRYYRPSDLIALSCQDLCIRVIDAETKKLVRELWGCDDRINDLCFSNDGRWIVAASADAIIRVWDLPTGNLIDAIRSPTMCTALAFSHTGEFLATAHADYIGVNIWNNRTLFTTVPTRQITEAEISQIILPTASGEGSQPLLEAAFSEPVDESNLQNQEENLTTTTTTLDQLSADIMTLSLVPRTRWQTLLHLDLIKQRNKPREPPKAPEKAPFFLPALEPAPKSASAGAIVALSGETTLDNADAAATLVAERTSRIVKMDRGASESAFTTLLRAAQASGKYGAFVEHLKGLAPAAADLEIRSLRPLAADTGGSSSLDGDGGSSSGGSELTAFVAALTERLRLRRDYELVQAWMSVFLRVHGEWVGGDARLVAELGEWRAEQRREGERLGRLMGYCGGVVGFLRSAR